MMQSGRGAELGIRENETNNRVHYVGIHLKEAAGKHFLAQKKALT